MKTFVLLFALLVSTAGIAQDFISKDAKYIGIWTFDGDREMAPEIFDDLPQYELFFASGEDYSRISFPAHDELGYPQPRYFIAKVEENKMSGNISRWKGASKTDEKITFAFKYDSETDKFSLQWKGKWYRYRRP